MEPKAIAAIVEKIARSPLSVSAYFKRHKVPFGRSRYFQYKAQLAANGLDGLVDGRSGGNRRELTAHAQGFIRGVHQENPQLSLRQIADRVESSCGLRVSRMTVSRCLRAVGLKVQWPLPVKAETIESSCGGFEIIGALALHLGWGRHTAEMSVQERERFRRTAAYRGERVWRDREGRNRQGQFTGAYNRRAEICAQRFASVEDKRKGKNYSRMALFQSSEFVLERKCLGLLALPLITLNGLMRSANNPLGNALEHFCGYNYQHHTLDKFLRELKYLGISDRLLRDQVSFWRQHWHEFESAGLPFLCYYVDGNTKPLWSKKRVKQNKVTMLGRVMGCLEQVFVHDAFGHPVYLETYAGKAPLGARILGLMEKVEEALEGPGPPLRVTRVIVMDAASNGVATLRAFAEQDRYHYITALDDNQWNPRKVREQGRAKRYYYGEATLRDCQLELEDSREKGYLVVVRAIRIDWDHGKTTVLITSLPRETVVARLVVKAYFDRWPHEELQFRSMKSFACLNRVAGYGKKKLSDETVRAKQKELGARITEWRKKLAVPLEAMAGQEERLALSMEKQRRIHSRCPIVKGRRVVEEESQVRLTSLGREIAQYRRQMKSIQAEWGKDLKRLRNYEQQWLRLQGKDFVYQIDVELDQIMGFFRISLVNLSCWFLRECLGRSSMSLSKLLHTILLMPAEIELTKEVRRVKLRRNPKDPEGMKKLEPALERLNELRIQHLDQKRIEFVLG